eukprot:scaffold7805_cov153-Amphora_coffeaeformis.AAC.1
MPKRKHKGGPEITFDPEARRNYLRGFSERKKQRRAYGLAMQKVKDRNERLNDRKERKASLMEQIEQSEKAKQELLEVTIAEHALPATSAGRRSNDDEDDDDDDDDEEVPMNAPAKESNTTAETQIKKYDDQETEKRWGGQVVVTTSTAIPGEDSDDGGASTEKKQVARPVRSSSGKPKHKDKAQEYAGSVDRYLSGKNNVNKLLLPGKKRKAQPRGGHKGKHGASDMKGVGGAAGLQAAQKILKRSKSKQSSSKEGKKRKRR